MWDIRGHLILIDKVRDPQNKPTNVDKHLTWTSYFGLDPFCRYSYAYGLRVKANGIMRNVLTRMGIICHYVLPPILFTQLSGKNSRHQTFFFLLYFPKKPGGKYCGVLAKHGLKRAPSYSLTLVLLLRSRGSPRTTQDTFLPLQLLERTITINGWRERRQHL